MWRTWRRPISWRPWRRALRAQVFNIGGGESISLLALLEDLGRLAEADLTPEFCPARAGEVRHSRADITHARHLLGYTPAVSLTAGLKRTLEASRDALSLPTRQVAYA